MKKLIIPNNYESKLNLLDTELAIKFVKDTFERDLADDVIKEKALLLDKIKPYIENGVKKVIVIKNKLVNIVV